MNYTIAAVARTRHEAITILIAGAAFSVSFPRLALDAVLHFVEVLTQQSVCAAPDHWRKVLLRKLNVLSQF